MTTREATFACHIRPKQTIFLGGVTLCNFWAFLVLGHTPFVSLKAILIGWAKILKI